MKQHNPGIRLFLVFGLLFAHSLLTLPGLAQETKQESESDDVLEHITVTARKQEVDLQKAAVAISVIDGEDFAFSNVVRLDNFNGYVPGLVISKNEGGGRVTSIRGVGWETYSNLSSQPSVLVYIDGIYLANSLAMGMDLGEIERIEVLRGPQGTEFGHGTNGGAINIITKKPVLGETSGTLSGSLGNYDQHRESASLNVGSDRLVLNASVQKNTRSGYAEIKGGELDGYDLDDADSLTASVSLLWQPRDNISLRFSGFQQDADHGGAAQKNINDPNPNPRELTQDYPSTFSLFNRSISAVLEWNVSANLTFRSLTGHQELEKKASVDGDRLDEANTSIDLTGFGASNFDVLPYWDNNSDAFSQELSLTYANEKTDWVIGVYYLDHENDNDFLEAVGPAPFSQFADQLANPGPETLPPFVAPLSFVETRIVAREDQAVYGQLTHRLNSTLALTFGGRYQKEEVSDTNSQFWSDFSTRIVDNDDTTWKAGIDFNLTENNLLYALISTGWKNGGSNSGGVTGGLDVPAFYDPEEVTSSPPVTPTPWVATSCA